jgi:nucleoside-diphosphate-sugar epimerase
MRVVVTGCAGFIGSHLTDRLLAEGDDVVGIDALTDNYDPQLKLRNLSDALGHPAFVLHRADLATDPVASLLEGADAVVHLAGEPGVRSSYGAGALRHHRHNVIATRRILAAARPGQRLVLASSSSVVGSESPYAQSKAAAERLWIDAAVRRGIDAVVLRPFTVYGPRQRPDMAAARFIAAARAGRHLQVHGDGTQERDFTYVADVVDAFVRAARAPFAGGHVLDIGGGSPVSVRELIEAVARAAARPLVVRHGPEQAGDVARTCADPGPAAAELGWAPTVNLADGIAAQWRAGDVVRLAA